MFFPFTSPTQVDLYFLLKFYGRHFKLIMIEKKNNKTVPYVVVVIFGSLFGSTVFLVWLRNFMLAWSAFVGLSVNTCFVDMEKKIKTKCSFP